MFWGLKEWQVVCATVCVKSEVILDLAVRQSEPNQQNLSYNFQLDKENDTGIHTTSLLMNLSQNGISPTYSTESEQTDKPNYMESYCDYCYFVQRTNTGNSSIISTTVYAIGL